MSYDVAELDVLDRIRGRLGDTSNVPATESFSDATYESVIAQYSANEWAATAEMGSRLLRLILSDVKSYTDQGVMSVTFRDPSDLQARIAEWSALAAAQDAAAGGGSPSIVTISDDIFFGSSEEWL